ncbi:MAG: HEPN domain-containing protein [Alphaproteobacteria bacterium]|nr:HEPN domain-containing protein [Alphaproteobacteria bacterium]
MSDLKCARLMLRLAERDLRAMQSLSAEAPEEAFGFFVQQALEKAFKAWLALLGELYPLTHSLETLLDRLAERGVDVEPWRETERYTPYAVQFRYTGVDPETEAIDREAAAEAVRTLLARVTRELAAAEGGTERG